MYDFDIERITPGHSVIFIGGRMRGKTTAIKDLLLHNRNIPTGLVVVPTNYDKQMYQEFIPANLINTESPMSQLGTLIRRQKQKIEDNWENPEAFVVLDDATYHVNNLRHNIVEELFYNTRYLQLLNIISFQGCRQVPPSIRANADYVFMFYTPNEDERERLYDGFLTNLITFEKFNDLMASICTVRFMCLVIDRTVTSTRMEDFIFFYKAKLYEYDEYFPRNTIKKRQDMFEVLR